MDHYLRPHTKINSRRATAVAALACRGGGGRRGKDHWQREVHRQLEKVQGSAAGLAVPVPHSGQ